MGEVVGDDFRRNILQNYNISVRVARHGVVPKPAAKLSDPQDAGSVSDDSVQGANDMHAVPTDASEPTHVPLALWRMSRPACLPSRKILYKIVGFASFVTMIPALAFLSTTLFCSVFIAVSYHASDMG